MRYAISLICALSTTIASANAANSVAVLRQFQPPLSAERSTDLRLARTSGGQLWVVTSEAAECWQKNDRGEFQRSGSWPLPAALTPLHSLHVAPIDAKQAWIVDATERRAWRIQNGTWSKAIQLPDEIGGATALVTGDIVINTPAHSGHALAVVDTAGEVRVRFGGRIASKVAQQAPMSNTWRLTTLPGGKDIAAAHAYLPILRTYKSAGTLIRETTITIPSVAVIEQRRKELESTITVNVEECCISSKVVHFATAISADGERIAVRYGLDPKLETFALDGTWAETIGVGVTVEKQRWLAAGIAFFEDAVVAAELDRIAVYRRATTAVTRGSVIDEKGAPITGAVVTLTGFGGSRVVITTGATGTFEVRGIPATDPATVSVAANSYLSLQRAGALEEITLQPFVLHSIPEQCVIVRSALDGDVIKEYRLRIGQSKAGQGTVFRNEGTSLQIQDEEGRGCLPTPLTPPLFVQVSAKGHATREVELANASEIEIELQSEVPLRVLTKSDTGAPVAAVKIYVIRADQKRGGTFAVSDEVIVTTDEEGIATLSGLEANQYVVLAEHPQYVRVEKTVKLAENTGDVEIVMDRGAQLTVEVLDATTRQPLADTLVHADPRNVPMTEALLCTTGSDGTCDLSGLPVGRYGIRAEHAGYARGAETVVVGPSERHPRVVVHLSNATAISGRVAGMESYPGVSMQVQVAKPGVPGIQAPVGTDGEYRISEAPTGTVSLWVTETGVDSTLLHHRTEIPAGVANYRVDLQLPRPLRLSGRIVDSSGMGCGACSIIFDRVGGDWDTTSRRGSPQGNGRYEARLTAPGPYVARIRDGSSGATLNEAVTITADTERNFRLGARSLEVRVKNHNETAVPNALVTVHAGDIPIDEMIADSYGTAQFRSIAPEKIRVTATHEGRMASREVALDRDATTVQIVLSDDGSLRLKVVDAVSLIPIYRLAARVTGAQGGSILRTDLVRDKDGVFVLPSFGTGPMTVVLESNGYAVRTMEGVMNSEGIQTVSLVPGARAFTVEVDLSVIRPCSIEVRGATGRPVALSARAGAGPVPFTLASAMFSGPEWGIYQVLLHDCSGQTTAKTLRLVDGGDRNVRFP